MPTKRPYTIYVIRLKNRVINDPRFRQRNAQYILKNPCVYVGMTYLSAEERYEQHKNGIHSARIVRNYHRDLMNSECRRTRPITQRRALKREAALAQNLRERGWGVWSN